MQHGDEELDYLAGAQPYENPASFERVVKEAFLLELDCAQNQDIADVLGVDKSRVSQIFGNPSNLKPETIQKVLDQLRSKEHKRQIVEAWMRECFGTDILHQSGEPLVGKKITEKTVRRVDRQIRESRLTLAAKTATEAAQRTDDPTMRERLLDRAFFARQRLDQPGQAMRVARIIAEGAIKRGDLRRAATGYCLGGRVMRGMADAKERETIHVLDRAEALLAMSEPLGKPAPPYLMVTYEVLEVERINTLVTLMERDQIIRDDGLIKKLKTRIEVRLKEVKSYQEKSRLAQLLARMYLLLDQAFLAEELLEQSFKSGDIKNLNAYEVSGVINARIIAKRKSPEASAEYLDRVIENCTESLDLYHGRLAEHDLARLERHLMIQVGS
ncbi:hypothetical protein CCB80_08740 [Armatimonadetes bacterium Uphvl-Ar1]|nr:hypothetical protein CCB80_08740 [Armatimonadetes bacterium Uphvl-Ar1]